MRGVLRSIALALSFAAATFTALMPATANALSLIRDAEIENTIRVWSTPLFEAAGLVPDDVRIILVNDRRLNAFVAGGQNLFLNTGLLLRCDHAGQVIGVIAHETGHIAGGHLARLPEALRQATATRTGSDSRDGAERVMRYFATFASASSSIFTSASRS